MTGIADRRIHEAIAARLATGPASVEDLVALARTAAGGRLGRQEGAVHALLHGLVRAGRAEAVGRGPRGGAVYAVPGVERPPSPDDPVPIPPPIAPRASRFALRVAGGVRDPEDRGRVVSDVIAHRLLLEEEGRAGEFGPAKAVRTLLARVDRGQGTICVPENGWERGVRFARHEGPSLVVTLAILGLLYAFVGEFRVVPTGSMQPVLKPGDRLVVQKLGGRDLPARWRVAVFHKPSDGQVLVKRVVGLPGERLFIRDGDLYVDGKIAVKPDDVREAVREPLLRQTLSEGRASLRPPRDAEQGWQQEVADEGEPMAQEWIARYANPLFADLPAYLDEHGHLEFNPPPRPLAHDVYVTIRASDEAGIRIDFVDDAGRPPHAVASVVWQRGGGAWVGTIARPGDPWSKTVRLAEVPARPGADPLAVSEATFSLVDGVLRLRSEGLSGAWPLDVAGGHAVVHLRGDVRTVAIDRDVHYTNIGEYATDPGNPFTVPEGHVFCLGDHSAHSGDCRLRGVGPIPLDRLIGPVVFRVWPPSRIGPVH